MREKHPLGRRLLALTAAVCTLGSLAVVPAANAEQATPDKPVAQQTTSSDSTTQQATPQAGKADGVQKPETGTDTQAGNAGKPADTNTQQKPAASNGNGGSADAAGQSIPLNAAYFPDAKFRGIVAKFDTNKDGELSQAERDAVTEINAGVTWWDNAAWDLKSAKGVEYFPNLTTLDLSFTGITELDLSANLKLQTLNLGACHFLTKLNITKNTSLKTVRLNFAASLASLDLPAGDKQLEFTNNDLGDDTAPQLLAVRGGTFKSYFYNGRAVEGDNLDLVKATGFTADELKGHILVEYLDRQSKKAVWKPFDGTILKPEAGESNLSYLYFPNLGDRDKLAPDLYAESNPPFMRVNVAFISPSLSQKWEDIINADSSEFPPEIWNEWEKFWNESMLPVTDTFGFPHTKQGVWDYAKYVLTGSAAGDDGGGMDSSDWEDQPIYEIPKELTDNSDRPLPVTPKDVPSPDALNRVTIPPMSFVSYYYEENGKQVPVNGTVTLKPGQTIVFKAKVKDGYSGFKLADGKNWQWTRTGHDLTVTSEKPSLNGDVLTVSPVTGVEYYYTYDKDGKDLQSFGNQTSIRVGGRPVWVVAKPAEGYQFADNKAQVTYGPYSYTAPNPPDNGGNNGGSGDNGNNNGGTAVPSATIVDVERFYNPRSGEHFYTAGATEQSVLRASGWRDEGVAFRMSSDKGTPVYRLYNPGGKHLFTTSERERDVLIKAKWNYEGIAFYVPDGAKTDVHRLYNPGNGDHLLTTSANERGVLVMHKWRDEGIAFKAE